MKKIFFIAARFSLLSATFASAADVVAPLPIDIVIDSGSAVRYVLKSLNILDSGLMTVTVTSTDAPPVTSPITLTISPATGGTLSADINGPYSCPGAQCNVTISPKANGSYAFTTWGGDCLSFKSAPTCTLEMTASRTVSAIFTSTVPPPAADACNPSGTTIVDVVTSVPFSGFSQQNYYPTPSTIHAFALKKVTADNVTSSNYLLQQASVAQLGSSNSGKLMVVSTCRGDVDTAGKDSGCYMYDSEMSYLRLLGNYGSTADPKTYCNLKKDVQYYLNVVPRETSSGVANCKSVSNCGFSFRSNF